MQNCWRSPLLFNPDIRVWVPLAVVPDALALKVLNASVGNAQYQDSGDRAWN
ncbi:hypothetical protein [Leptolyngbya sp. FACHB-671]|uniref:hypothetical protein n=1 Tax=Leptolyngbya sp. FACHB-671 TaxID=2692812 RepID=UPI001686DCE2|nr:hypothetical protein [Leptolyngbya sp. FACHB-671]